MMTIAILLITIGVVGGIALALRNVRAARTALILLLPWLGATSLISHPTFWMVFGAFFGCLAGMILRRIIDNTQREVIPRRWLIMTFLYVTIGTISVGFGHATIDVMNTWIVQILIPAFFFIALLLSNGASSNRDRRNICATMAIVSMFAVIQFFIPECRVEPWNGLREAFRATSIFPHPNIFSMFLGPLVAYIAIDVHASVRRAMNNRRQYEGSNKRFMRTMAAQLAMLICATTALVATRSFGAIVACVGAIMVTVLLGMILSSIPDKRRRTRIALAILAGGGVMLCALTLVPPVRNVLEGVLASRENSAQLRIDIWKGAWTLLSEHPVRGVGLGQFEGAFHDIRPLSHVVDHPTPHNLYLAWWLELSLAGLLVMGGALLLALRTLWKNRRDAEALAVLAAMLTIAIHGLIDTPYFHPTLTLMFWFLMANTVEVERRSKNG